MENVVITILEKYSGKKAREGKIGVCMNPEFLTEIEHSWTEDNEFKKDFFREDRIINEELKKKYGVRE